LRGSAFIVNAETTSSGGDGAADTPWPLVRQPMVNTVALGLFLDSDWLSDRFGFRVSKQTFGS
jgi:hypothetical protein